VHGRSIDDAEATLRQDPFAAPHHHPVRAHPSCAGLVDVTVILLIVVIVILEQTDHHVIISH